MLYLNEAGAHKNITDKNGLTALAIAVRGGSKKVVSLFVEGGMDATIADKDGCTPLWHACAGNLMDIASILLHHRESVKNVPVRHPLSLF